MADQVKPFNVRCGYCGKRRGFLPHPRHGRVLPEALASLLRDGVVPAWAGLLICRKCDYIREGMSLLPREGAIRDVGGAPAAG